MEIEREYCCEYCQKIGKLSFNITQKELLSTCRRSIFDDPEYQNLTDDLKKDFAISLFIAGTKRQSIDVIQQYKKDNIRQIGRSK